MNLESHAEVMKLARLLDTPPERLDYLGRLDPADTRALRERANDVFHEDDRRLGRVALASRIPPAPVTAWIAQHLFGPLLCARVAGLLDTRHAVDLAKRMPPEFLAQLAMHLDPRRARDIIFALPPALIGKVAAELDRRDEHIAMGRFVGNMTDAALLACFAVIDGPTLLRISYFVEEKAQLDHVVGPARRRARARGDPLGVRGGPVAAGARPADARHARASGRARRPRRRGGRLRARRHGRRGPARRPLGRRPAGDRRA